MIGIVIKKSYKYSTKKNDNILKYDHQPCWLLVQGDSKCSRYFNTPII